MSVALNKWVTESALELPAVEPPLKSLPAPAQPTAAATPVTEMPVNARSRLEEARTEPVAEPAPESSASFAASAEEDRSTESEYQHYNWKETFGTHTAAETNYYEILQISPNADTETIHRVYRILASRFHPDNPRTGNVERFYVLSKAFEVLSNPKKRLAYDANFRLREQEPAQIFRVEDFVDGVKGEENRRLGVLSLLYNRRRIMEDSPGLSLLELERRMAVPREYLHFTVWYLRQKDYVRTVESNSDLALTANGVDYVEKHCSTNHVIRELLTAGKEGGEARSERIMEHDHAAA
jgi:hypothetical protein